MIQKSRSAFRRNRAFGSFAVCALAVVLLTAKAQSPDSDAGVVKRLSPERIVQLLRGRNGLETAANLTGTFVIDGQRHLWGDLSLSALVSESTLAVAGTVTKKTSRLSDDGDYIYTDCTVSVERTLKGTSGSPLVFEIPGGVIQFANGMSAQVTTIEWQELQVGEKYLLLLRSGRSKELIPTNGVQALFKLSTKDGIVESFAVRQHVWSVIKDVKEMQSGTLIAAVQSAVTAAH